MTKYLPVIWSVHILPILDPLRSVSAPDTDPADQFGVIPNHGGKWETKFRLPC